MDEISENILNEKLNKQSLEKNSAQRKLYLTEYQMEIQTLERRNSEYELFESKMKNRLHQECYARSCQQLEELRKRFFQEEFFSKKKRRLEEFPTQHDQESRTVTLFFYDTDLLSSCDGSLLPRVRENLAAKLECREIHK